jgi:hypothetical protein
LTGVVEEMVTAETDITKGSVFVAFFAILDSALQTLTFLGRKIIVELTDCA